MRLEESKNAMKYDDGTYRDEIMMWEKL